MVAHSSSPEKTDRQYCAEYDPDPFGIYLDLPRCTDCGAIATISGAPMVGGGWMAHADLILRHGLDYDERHAWTGTVTAAPQVTALAGGRCQWCREDGTG